MAKLTPAEYVEKHNRRLKGAIQDMQKGVENVTESPTEKAAAKQDKMRTNLVASIDNGKWAKGLRRVSLQEWKDKMITKGVGRVAAGIDAAAPKVLAFAEELLPHLDMLKKEISKMPDVTLEDNINRMVAHTRGMSKFKRKG